MGGMVMDIAKYREQSFPGRWWLTDFTMEQVEKRISTLTAELERVKAEKQRLMDEPDELWQVYKEKYQRLRKGVEAEAFIIESRWFSWPDLGGVAKRLRALLNKEMVG